MIPFAVAALISGVMIWQQRTPETVLLPAPEVVFPDIRGTVWEELPTSGPERDILPPDTDIRRRSYRDDDGHWYVVTAVIGGRSKQSVHRPELCLPGQGFQMSDPHTIRVGGISWRILSLERGRESRVGFAYTFANGTGFKTSSHLARIFTDVWDRSILGRIDRWVMLTVSSSCSDDADLSRFLEKLEGVVR